MTGGAVFWDHFWTCFGATLGALLQPSAGRAGLCEG